MIPGYGPDCDLCTPDVHYALKCEACGRDWDEPPCPELFVCPVCGVALEVTLAEHDAWKSDVLGTQDSAAMG